MKIIYAENNYFTIYDTQSKVVQTVYDSLDQILQYLKAYDRLLLPEHHFIYTSKQYSFYTNKAFTLKDSKELLQQYIVDQKKILPSINQLIHYDIHSISVNGSKKSFALGHTGQLLFQMDCIFGNSISELDFDIIQNKKIQVLPMSFGTIKQCNTLVSEREYSILYIQNQESKLIQIEHGFYHEMSSINFGKEDLKTMYKEHHLLKYYRDPESTSPVTESIVKDISSFFAEKMIDWLSGIISPNTNMLIVSDLTKNTYCMESLKKLYSKFINGYIIPVSLANSDPGVPVDISTTVMHIIKLSGK